MKILHISDLHFCSDKYSSKIKELEDEITSIFPSLDLDIKIEIADKKISDSLKGFVHDKDPEIIVITGDITTFGDKESFEVALEWINDISVRRDGKIRNFFIVPGNHDVLKEQLAYLIRNKPKNVPYWIWKGFLWWVRKPKNIIEDLIAKDGDFSPSVLSEFYKFIESKPNIANKQLALDLDKTSQVAFIGFTSISTDSLWMNIGQQREEEKEKIYTQLRMPDISKPGTLRILALHHNPISSPKITEPNLKSAYNSMPGGTEFLSEIQKLGIDIILHGHQHVESKYSFDFDLQAVGHAFTIGSQSSTKEGNAGCNIITIEDINHITVTHCKYGEGNKFHPGDPHELCLERNRPLDLKTNSTRYEIKRYKYNDELKSFWTELYEEDAKIVYITGRRVKTIRDDKFKIILKILDREHSKIRLMYNDPELLYNIAKSTHKQMWGTKEGLEDLMHDVLQSKDALSSFVNEKLTHDQKGRIDIRVSHTLLPFGATALDPDKPWGKMGIKLLPIGALGDLAEPEMKLNRRYEKAMYEYYLDHLKFLLLRGTHIEGGWTDETDLK